MTRAYFPPSFVFLFRIYPHVVPSAPLPLPSIFVLWMNTGEGRICFVFLLCLLGHDVLLLGLEAGGESYNWICRLASVVVGQGKGKGRE